MDGRSVEVRGSGEREEGARKWCEIPEGIDISSLRLRRAESSWLSTGSLQRKDEDSQTPIPSRSWPPAMRCAELGWASA